MQHLSGFAPLAARYDGFIVDLWGVIHDGVTAYPGAADCLARLRDAGKPVVLLSNAPRRSEPARRAMEAMGVGRALYAELLTSGEATHRALADPPDAWFARLGHRVFHLGPARDRSVIDGLDLALADGPGDADFVLNTGPDDERSPTDLADFEEVLVRCARHRLPMVCANPDLVVIRDGVMVLCAGALAARYQTLGGDVRSIGKPDPAIYQPVLRMLDVEPSRALAVGDSLRTDIAGAAEVGIASCWVLDGIHGLAAPADASRADQAIRDAGLSPVACIPRFRWQPSV